MSRKEFLTVLWEGWAQELRGALKKLPKGDQMQNFFWTENKNFSKSCLKQLISHSEQL